ncbi:tissue inhibitor of metalloproteinase-like [Microplitis mediator]|uniref:tissue inhibitor of metalloproteinase-like n=1 Tax=Microplitis mediator TaxID=375433 RepID=UPI0025567B1A|nr:tissue inhibitor of metalloproteinase-like [Microplitis mediator]
MKRILILFILGSLTIDNTNGCSCATFPLQTKFCKSDFVIKIKVTDIQKTTVLTSTTNIYHVDILETYRANAEAVEALKLKYLTTDPFRGMCGLRLRRDQIAVVGGIISGGEPAISVCRLHIKSPQEIEAQSVNLRENFSKNCTTA